MQLLLDNLGASIIAGTVMLMVVSLQLRAQQTAVEAAVAYRGKAHTMRFADMISTEFPKIGEGTSDTTSAIQDHSTADGQTQQFVFMATTTPGGPGVEIQYNLIVDDTISVERWDEEKEDQVVVEVPIYRMERVEDGGSETVVMTNIKHWAVELLDSDGDPTSTISDVRQLRVRLSCLYEAGSGDARTVHRTLWGSTFRPTSLRLQ